MTQGEIDAIIQKLDADCIRNKSGLQDMANDNKWDDYGIPYGLKKKIEAFLNGGEVGSGGDGNNDGNNDGNVCEDGAGYFNGINLL